jgi:ABC-type polysaccharide/polyol phosphate transport system ATPase subunit
MDAENNLAIQAKDLHVSFLVQKKGIRSIKSFLISMGFQSPFEKKPVLKGLNLEVRKGECLAVMGRNGSGKSTLLRAVAGIMIPTSGTLKVNGRVAPLMTLGVGFEMELTGLENIELVGTLMGLSKSDLKFCLDNIVKFSELTDEELGMQMKRYSSGMISRLAFSIAAANTPDVLIIDEALAVGDLGFREKCAERIRQIKAEGSTILYVSHHLEEIKSICTRAIFIQDGIVKTEGDVDAVCDYYTKHVRPTTAELHG